MKIRHPMRLHHPVPRSHTLLLCEMECEGGVGGGGGGGVLYHYDDWRL